MPRYEVAPAEVRQIVERMMERYHPQLRDSKVSIECLSGGKSKHRKAAARA